MKLLLTLLILLPGAWSLPSARIIGGKNASVTSFPFAAAIYKTTSEGNYFCAGSILNNQWIITAGQCIDGFSLLTIVLGSHKLNDLEPSAVKVATSTYFLHPEFNSSTLENDIGLIKLREPITFTNYIRNLHLPLYSIGKNATTAVVSGWGQTTDQDTSLSNVLQYVVLSSLTDSECKLYYGNQITENMICFGGNNNEGTCHGDAGSPLMQTPSRGHTEVIAVSSFFSGNGCESADPSGFTKVYPYNKWINEVINNNTLI